MDVFAFKVMHACVRAFAQPVDRIGMMTRHCHYVAVQAATKSISPVARKQVVWKRN
jgi:hypothetical protein